MRARPLRGVSYDPGALDEYGSQLTYYGLRGQGVAERFHEAVQAAIEHATRRPDAFFLVDAATGTRSVVVKHFPFKVMYTIRGDMLLVVAVAHTSRNVEHYLGRL